MPEVLLEGVALLKARGVCVTDFDEGIVEEIRRLRPRTCAGRRLLQFVAHDPSAARVRSALRTRYHVEGFERLEVVDESGARDVDLLA